MLVAGHSRRVAGTDGPDEDRLGVGVVWLGVMRVATEAAKSVANAEYEQKVYEITIAELLGVDRMTVRRWLGKRRVQDGKF